MQSDDSIVPDHGFCERQMRCQFGSGVFRDGHISVRTREAAPSRSEEVMRWDNDYSDNPQRRLITGNCGSQVLTANIVWNKLGRPEREMKPSGYAPLFVNGE